MVKRITIYGWLLKPDPIYGKGSGTLVDFVYFVDDDVSIQDIFQIIERGAGCRIIPKRIENRRNAPVEQDKVTIEDWDSHITVGSERITESPSSPAQVTYENYNRYNFPMGADPNRTY